MLLATALVVVVFAPVAVFAATDLDAGSLAAVLGGLTGLIAGMIIGGRFALGMTLLLVIAEFAAYLALPHAVAAGVVMAVVALGYGLLARRGATSVGVTVPIAVLLTLTTPPGPIAHRADWVTALVVALGALVGGLWGSSLGAFAGRRMHRPTLGGITTSAAWIYAGTLAIVTGIAAAVVVQHNGQKGGEWLILTIFIVVQPTLHESFVKTLHRVGGTAGGFLIVAAISALTDSTALLVVLGIAFAIAAVTVKLESQPYWLYVLMLTPAIVLAEGASSDVLELDATRLEFTLIGAAIAVAILGMFRLIANRYPSLLEAPQP